MTQRGGPQIIPRPEEWRSGDPAPWHDADIGSVSLARVRESLAERGRSLTHSDGLESETPRSAVLVPLYEIGGEASVILTRRSPNLRSHTHQVSFPGGRADPTDVDPWATALREADEEIALDPRLPVKIGELDSFVAGGSQTFVTPLVGQLPHRPSLTPSEDEVEHILHVELAELLLPDVFREEVWVMGEQTRRISFFELHGDTVWGATAAMLRQLLGIVTRTDDALAH